MIFYSIEFCFEDQFIYRIYWIKMQKQNKFSTFLNSELLKLENQHVKNNFRARKVAKLKNKVELYSE